MAMFLVERYVERTQTLLEGVCAVAPGETRRFGGASTRSMVTAWPVPPSGRVQRSLRDHEEELLGTLREAVRVRMRAEGAVCAHVSGGLDSSAVAALATGLARETGGSEPMLVRCVFPGMECDESSHSQAVADHLRLPIASAEMPGELSEYTLNSTRAPRAYFANPVSRMLVRGIETARGLGARVTLTGAGSDQLMQATGYEAADAILRRDARAVLAWSSFWEAPLSRATYRRIARQGFGRAVPEQVRRSARALAGQGDGLPAWMTGSARSAVRRLSVPALGGGRFDGFARLPARRLATQLWWDPDYTFSIVAADAIGAAHGGELRHPFFDRRVIEMMLRLPAEVRSAGPPAKLFLRRAIGARLPASVAGRTSAAEFSPFVKAALIDAHGEELSEMMRESHLADAGLVEPGAVATLVERARRGEQEVLREVVTIAALEVWLRQAASGLLIHGLAPRGPSP
ncbi:MAG: asparagine synthase C-terminal domain-containing protein [Polyangiaceae bacterium]